MPTNSTQQFLEISQIREGLLVLRDQSLRAVMMVSSLNFALKSEEEQSSIISAFQSFLNSLDFSCQIVIQSRKLNITGYLDKIKELEAKQENELLRIQTSEYHDFIQSLVSFEFSHKSQGAQIYAHNWHCLWDNSSGSTQDSAIATDAEN